MPTEWETYKAGLEVKDLSDELGAQVMEWTDNRTHRINYRILHMEKNAFYREPHLQDFVSMFEVLGYLRAVKELKSGVLQLMAMSRSPKKKQGKRERKKSR
jgi:hypothetical protein